MELENSDVGALSIANACKRAGVGRTFIFEEIRSGRLKAKKAGRRTLVLREDLTAWLQALPSVDRDAELQE